MQVKRPIGPVHQASRLNVKEKGSVGYLPTLEIHRDVGEPGGPHGTGTMNSSLLDTKAGMQLC